MPEEIEPEIVPALEPNLAAVPEAAASPEAARLAEIIPLHPSGGEASLPQSAVADEAKPADPARENRIAEARAKLAQIPDNPALRDYHPQASNASLVELHDRMSGLNSVKYYGDMNRINQTLKSRGTTVEAVRQAIPVAETPVQPVQVAAEQPVSKKGLFARFRR